MNVFSWIRNLPIGRKLGLLSALFVLPVLWLSWQVWKSQGVAIAFGEKEIAGLDYLDELGKLRQIQEELRSGAGGDAKAAWSGVEKAQKSLGRALACAVEFEALAAATQSGPSEAAGPLNVLWARVGDQSNLILDPDLDSYYLMDAVVLRVPELLDILREAETLGAARKGSSAQADFNLHSQSARLAASLGVLQRGHAVAYEQAQGKILREALQPLLTRLEGDLSKAQRQIEACAQGRDCGRLRAALGQARGLVFEQLQADSAQLRNLLKIRISGFSRSRLSTMALAGLIAILCLALSYYIGASLARPLRRLARATRLVVEEGDLSQQLHSDALDEVGQLTRDLGELVNKLRELPQAIQSMNDTLLGAVAELKGAVAKQNETVTRQATALQETQVTAEEIKQTSQMAAKTAAGILEEAAKADELGKSGEASVEQSMLGLAELKSFSEDIAGKIAQLDEKTRQIGGITNTVKELADQSNMLALNAAIEAVRSGEHGKGFSLVAREIRRLADQSIQATERVREILEAVADSTGQAVKMSDQGQIRVEQGLGQVRHSGDNLRLLAGMVKNNAAGVRQIASAVNQQNIGIGQVFGAVVDQNKMMEETVRNIEDTSRALESVQKVVEGLSQVVHRYKF